MSGNSRKPNQNYPLGELSTRTHMPNFIPDPSIQGVNFDQLLNQRGIRFLHRRFAPCPNLTRVENNNHDPNCTVCDGNGGVYYCEQEIWGVFHSNSLQKNFEAQGMWEIGTAVITFPVEYGDGSIAEFQTYDRLEIPDFPVRMWQRVNYELSIGGTTKLRYPIDTIDIVFSVRNGVKFDFVQGVDYDIENGDIKWIAGRQPLYDNVKECGEALSVVYHANPVYTVLQHMRELRVSQEYQVGTGTKIARKLPQQVLVRKQFLVKDNEQEPSV